MARAKRIKAAPLTESAKDLLTRIKEAVADKVRDYEGKPLENYDPVIQLAVFAAQTSDSDDASVTKLRIDAAKEVSKYVHAQLKSNEVAGPGGGPVEIKIIDY